MADDIAIQQIKADEGFRGTAYICPAGALTIGYGRNIDIGGTGVSEAEASMLLANDVAACEADLRGLFHMWDFFGPVRRSALINLRFQLGPNRFRAFRKMIAAIDKGDWMLAAAELADSALTKQTPARNGRRVRELEQG